MAIRKPMPIRMADAVLLTLGNKVEAIHVNEDGVECWELFAEFGDECYPVTDEKFASEDAAWDAWHSGVEYIMSKVNGKEIANV